MLYMILCSVLWSMAGIFIKLIPWHPFAIAGWRSLIAAGVFGVYMLCAKKKLRVNRHSVLSAVFLCATFIAFVTANKMTTAANAIVLQFTAPVFILIISAVFFRQRFKLPDVLVVVLTLAGISLFFLDQLSPGNMAGNCIAILAGLVMALMYIFTAKADDDSRMSGILFGHLLTAAAGIPFSGAEGAALTGQGFLYVSILGVVQLGIPYLLYAIAVRKCPPLMCSLIGGIEPLLNPVWVFLIDGEAPGLFALFGAVVVIATVSLWCCWQMREQNKLAQPARSV